jgi:SAM-dependent methyltransferase
MPLSDGFLTEEQLDKPEPVYPLEAAFCGECSLVQIMDTVDPEELFANDYAYYSSFSDELLRHSRANALELIDSRSLDSESLVVELASNDGYLLRNYAEKGVPVLGIDPADGPAREARTAGIETLNTFFTVDLAQTLAAEGVRADVIHANNVLAHVADTNGFVEGIAAILKDAGVAVIEAPYVRELVDNCEFDTIYHEHLCYFSVTALDALFRRHGLYLQSIRQLSIHGGSLRLYVGKRDTPDASVMHLLESEASAGVADLSYYRTFASRVAQVKETVAEMIAKTRSRRPVIGGYGAAAKGTILINYIDLGPDIMPFIADKNIHKHGKYMPGKHQPIVPPETILEANPDYLFILPWNFSREIMHQQDSFKRKGGKFIVPIPYPQIL